MNTKEAILLLAIYSAREVEFDGLTQDQKDVVAVLLQRGYVKYVGKNIITSTPHGVLVVKVFKSGLNFEQMLSRLKFTSVTKLLHQIFNKCFTDGIHLNVIFKNMSPSDLDVISNEIEIAREFIKEQEQTEV